MLKTRFSRYQHSRAKLKNLVFLVFSTQCVKNNDESAYREEVRHLTDWCSQNNLDLNTSKTKELIVDYRRSKSVLPTLAIRGEEVERVESFKFLGVHISADLTWTTHTSVQLKKAHQRLYFLRKLKQSHLPCPLLVNFYRASIESILTYCCTVWSSSCTAKDRQDLQCVVRTAEKIIGTTLPPLRDIYTGRLQKKARSISTDPPLPRHALFSPLPSGKRSRFRHYSGTGFVSNKEDTLHIAYR